MKLEYATMLARADSQIEVVTDYSGRGMFGEMTTAITFSDWFIFCRAVAEVSASLVAPTDTKAAERFASEMGRIRTNNLGRNIIVY
jgi:hypothetical protein